MRQETERPRRTTARLEPAASAEAAPAAEQHVRWQNHLRHEPLKESKSRIKRLRGIQRPRCRLRIGEIRVFYDVSFVTVEVLAVVPKSKASEWLEDWENRNQKGDTVGSKGRPIEAESFKPYHWAITIRAGVFLAVPRLLEVALGLIVLRFRPRAIERWIILVGIGFAGGRVAIYGSSFSADSRTA